MVVRFSLARTAASTEHLADGNSAVRPYEYRMAA